MRILHRYFLIEFCCVVAVGSVPGNQRLAAGSWQNQRVASITDGLLVWPRPARSRRRRGLFYSAEFAERILEELRRGRTPIDSAAATAYRSAARCETG
jgi:hypothetical protein